MEDIIKRHPKQTYQPQQTYHQQTKIQPRLTTTYQYLQKRHILRIYQTYQTILLHPLTIHLQPFYQPLLSSLSMETTLK